MSNIRSVMVILPELRDGRVVAEMSEQIRNGIAAVRQFGKPAKITLEVTIAPAGKDMEKLIEAPLTFTGEVSAKLPQAEAEKTIMFVDADGNATRNPTERQPGLGLTVAGATQNKA